MNLMEIAAPEQLGFSAERLSRIRPVMQAYVEQQKLPGILTLLARRGEVVHCETVGLMDIEANKSMREDAIFRIASLSKPVTTVAAMMLYEEGCFQLSDPISRCIPGFKDVKVQQKTAGPAMKLVALEREISFHDLLRHTSGLNVEKNYDLTLAENVQEFVKAPLIDQPGTVWRYGQSTNVLAHLVELISGTRFDRFLQERVFDPLRMVDTGFFVPPQKLERLTAVYTPAAGGGLALAEPAQGSPFAAPRPLLSGSSGLVSTAADYLRFAQMLLNGGELDGVRLLGRKTAAYMLRNHLPQELLPFELMGTTCTGLGFGLGGYVVLDPGQTGVLESAGSFGWIGSFSTYFWLDPQEEIVGMLLTQFVPIGRYPLEAQFKTLAYQALVD